MLEEKKRIRKLAWIIAIYQILGSYALIIIQNYGNYIFTNVAKLSPAVTATCMSVSSIFMIIASLLDGALVQNTRSKWGQFRPWYMFGIYVCVFSGYLMYLRFGNSVILTAVVVSIGYALPQEIMNLLYTARIGMFTKMANGNAEANVRFNAYNWLGTYCGYFIAGATTVPLVNFFGKGSEAVGFMGAHTVYGIACFIGYAILVIAAKPYDRNNKDVAITKEKRASLGDMFKSVFTNKPGRIVLICDIVRFTAYYALMNLISYQCTYVLGDLETSATVFAVTNIGGLIGSYLVTPISDKLGRKTTMRIFDALAGACLLSIIFTGKTVMGLTVSVTLYMFFSAFTDGIDPALYMDAGQYALAKTGKDTRSYFNSMYNVAVKAAVGLAGVVSNGILAMIHFDPDMVFDAAMKSRFTTLLAVGCFAFNAIALILMFFHPLSDKEADEITAANTAAENAALQQG